MELMPDYELEIKAKAFIVGVKSEEYITYGEWLLRLKFGFHIPQ